MHSNKSNVMFFNDKATISCVFDASVHFRGYFSFKFADVNKLFQRTCNTFLFGLIWLINSVKLHRDIYRLKCFTLFTNFTCAKSSVQYIVMAKLQDWRGSTKSCPIEKKNHKEFSFFDYIGTTLGVRSWNFPTFVFFTPP